MDIRESLSYGGIGFVITEEGHGFLFKFEPNNYLGSTTLAFMHLLSQSSCGELVTLIGIRLEFHEQIMREILKVKKMPWLRWPTITELLDNELLKKIDYLESRLP